MSTSDDVFRSAGLPGARVGSSGSGTLDSSSVDGPDARTDHIMTWRKQGYEVPIFIQFNGYPPHVDESYQGRIRLVELTAIEISDLRAQDEGWYECSVVRLEGTDERTVNGSWIYLTINCTYLYNIDLKVTSILASLSNWTFCQVGLGRQCRRDFTCHVNDQSCCQSLPVL